MEQTRSYTESGQSRKPDYYKLIPLVFFVSVILYFGRALFIPFSFSLLISFILYPVCKWMENRGIHRVAAILLALTALIILVSALIYLLLSQFFQFMVQWDEFKIKLIDSFRWLQNVLAQQFNISYDRQQEWLRSLTNISGAQIFNIIQKTLLSFSITMVLLLLIPVFSALILYQRQQLLVLLHNLFPEKSRENIGVILRLSVTAYYNFIRGMLVVYLTVGTLNSIGLALIGIPNPILFGFIASILTFIPYVGIIVSSLLPITVSWVLFNSIWYPIGVIAVFAVVQVLEAYLIFPFAVSKRLHLNTLVTLLVIIAGGILWGAAGMILFVPFLGILKLIADHNPSMKTLSGILGKA